MGYVPKINRRSFVVGTTTAGAGLALGLKLPFGPEIVRAEDGSLCSACFNMILFEYT